MLSTHPLFSSSVSVNLMRLLPIFSVIIFETHVRFTALKTFGTEHPLIVLLTDLFNLSNTTFSAPNQATAALTIYGVILCWITFQALPMMIGWFVTMQRLTESSPNVVGVLNKITPLVLGFGLYPLIIYICDSLFVGVARFNYLSGQFYLLSVVALIVSVIALLSHVSTTTTKTITSTGYWSRVKNLLSTVFSTLISLNGIVAVTLFGWAFIMAGAFHYHENPLQNMPINLIIDIKQIATDPLPFLSYFWQFLVMASTVWLFYAINRYVLIGRVLSRLGVFHYLVGGFILWIMLTPIAGSLIVSLPINPVDFSFLPSENFNIFDPDNYKISLLILLFTTPLILAFERQQDVAKTALITEQKTQAELQLLQQQINPHFLFNSLNSLYALALKKSDDTPKLVLRLSDMLRYTVYEGQKQSVELSKEIEYLNNYIELQQTRIGGRVKIQWNPPSLDNGLYSIAPLLLIMIVENAFKHGAEAHSGNGFIKLDLTITQGQLRLVCTNTLAQQPQAESAHGIGLKNLTRRLELQYKDNYRYTAGPIHFNRLDDVINDRPLDLNAWQTTLELTVR